MTRPPLLVDLDVVVVKAIAPDGCSLCGRDVVPVLVRRVHRGEVLSTALGWAETLDDPATGLWDRGDAHTDERCRELRTPRGTR